MLSEQVAVIASSPSPDEVLLGTQLAAVGVSPEPEASTQFQLTVTSEVSQQPLPDGTLPGA